MKKYNFTTEEWENCIKVLTALKSDPFHNPDNELLAGLITKIYKTAKKVKRHKNTSINSKNDIKIIKNTIISKNALANKTNYATQKKQKTSYTDLAKPRNCYSCNETYQKAHFFYGRMCSNCAEKNYNQRFEHSDLNSRNAIITGGRVKIGFATALKLLRSNTNVMVTTRFPALALENFKKEKDYTNWKENLTVYGLDLRNLAEVKNFINYYKKEKNSLDILINNAAQTIKYTDEYYLPIVHKEQELLPLFCSDKNFIENKTPVINHVPLLTYDNQSNNFEINRFGQPIDYRDKTSWNSTLEEISTYELLEVNLINQISPFLMIKELTNHFKKSTFSKQFIINVTSSEGQFSYTNKTIFHPHTNMTKAALNMMTRTAAKDYEKNNILMYAVDVGWISTGVKEVLRKEQFENGTIPPLDSVDGAARIMHPILSEFKGESIEVGTLLKNYKIEKW